MTDRFRPRRLIRAVHGGSTLSSSVLVPFCVALLTIGLLSEVSLVSGSPATAMAKRQGRTFAYTMAGGDEPTLSTSETSLLLLPDSAFVPGSRPISIYTAEQNEVVKHMLQAWGNIGEIYPFENIPPGNQLTMPFPPDDMLHKEPWVGFLSLAYLDVSPTSECATYNVMCCTLYWVNEDNPPYLPESAVDPELIFMRDLAVVNGFFANFSTEFLNYVKPICALGDVGGRNVTLAVDNAGEWRMVPLPGLTALREFDVTDLMPQPIPPQDMEASPTASLQQTLLQTYAQTNNNVSALRRAVGTFADALASTPSVSGAGEGEEEEEGPLGPYTALLCLLPEELGGSPETQYPCAPRFHDDAEVLSSSESSFSHSTDSNFGSDDGGVVAPVVEEDGNRVVVIIFFVIGLLLLLVLFLVLLLMWCCSYKPRKERIAEMQSRIAALEKERAVTGKSETSADITTLLSRQDSSTTDTQPHVVKAVNPLVQPPPVPQKTVSYPAHHPAFGPLVEGDSTFTEAHDADEEPSLYDAIDDDDDSGIVTPFNQSTATTTSRRAGRRAVSFINLTPRHAAPPPPARAAPPGAYGGGGAIDPYSFHQPGMFDQSAIEELDDELAVNMFANRGPVNSYVPSRSQSVFSTANGSASLVPASGGSMEGSVQLLEDSCAGMEL